MFSMDDQAETCRHPPPPTPPTTPVLRLQPVGPASSAGLCIYRRKQWVSCLHAAPPATPPPVERAAVSGVFSLQLLSHAPSWMGSVMLESASPRSRVQKYIWLKEDIPVFKAALPLKGDVAVCRSGAAFTQLTSTRLMPGLRGANDPGERKSASGGSRSWLNGSRCSGHSIRSWVLFQLVSVRGRTFSSAGAQFPTERP